MLFLADSVRVAAIRVEDPTAGGG